MIPPQQIVNSFIGSKQEIEAFNKAISCIDYIDALSFRDQVGCLCNFLRNGTLNVSYERIGKIYNESAHCIWDQFQNYLRGERADGRPGKLTKEELQEIKCYIKQLHTDPTYPTYPTYADISYYISQKYNKYINDDTLRHYFYKDLTEDFKPIEALSKDANRLTVSIENIETNTNTLSRAIYNVPPDFVMNLDEVGCHDFVDAQSKTVIAPASCTAPVVYYPVGRSGKRASAIVCISLSGLVCPPQIAVPRATIDSEIFQHVPPTSFQIATTNSGFVTTESFSKWLKEIFLPYLHLLRQKNNYYGRAVLILDGFLPHKLSFEQIDLQGENLYIHYLVPHSSDQTQPLDLAIFGIMKKFMNDLKPPRELSYQSKQLYKIHQTINLASSQIK